MCPIRQKPTNGSQRITVFIIVGTESGAPPLTTGQTNERTLVDIRFAVVCRLVSDERDGRVPVSEM